MGGDAMDCDNDPAAVVALSLPAVASEGGFVQTRILVVPAAGVANGPSLPESRCSLPSAPTDGAVRHRDRVA